MWQEKDTYLEKQFSFESFELAIEFINSVSELAKRLNHHPKIINEYNKVWIELTTHSEGGVTDKDRELAKEIDKLQNQPKKSGNKILKLYTDGGSRGNPGHSAIGYAIYDQSDELIKSEGKYIGVTTNNQAEYKALKTGLKEVERLGASDVEVFMDSLLVVNQLKGEYKVKNQDLAPIFNEVKELSSHFKSIIYTHVPRAINKVADSIVNEVLDSHESSKTG